MPKRATSRYIDRNYATIGFFDARRFRAFFFVPFLCTDGWKQFVVWLSHTGGFGETGMAVNSGAVGSEKRLEHAKLWQIRPVG